MVPKTIQKALQRIADIEEHHSIEALKENHNNFFNIERRIKKGESVSNDYSKPLYSLY